MALPGQVALQRRLPKQQFQVAAQMVDALGCGFRALFGLGQDECALDGGLGVKSQAFRSPVPFHAALTDGFFDVGHEGGRVAGDALAAGLADGRMRVIDFLDHGSDQASEAGKLASQDGFAEIDISQQPIDRIGERMVGRGEKKCARAFAPVRGGGQGEVLFAAEVVKEAALGQAGVRADIFDACGRVALGAKDVQRRVQDFGLRLVLFFCSDQRCAHWLVLFVPTSGYAVKRFLE